MFFLGREKRHFFLIIPIELKLLVPSHPCITYLCRQRRKMDNVLPLLAEQGKYNKLHHSRTSTVQLQIKCASRLQTSSGFWPFLVSKGKVIKDDGTQTQRHRKRVSRWSWRFRSFYFSNNWEMLNTEQIKMPQSKLQKTDSNQPVVALFLYCQLCCWAVSRLLLHPRQISVYKK